MKIAVMAYALSLREQEGMTEEMLRRCENSFQIKINAQIFYRQVILSVFLLSIHYLLIMRIFKIPGMQHLAESLFSE